ncbi:MAG TPA: type II toxin-antitoxin system RelE/ParE family toxin [Mucilaginibacter sp.]
MAKEVILTPTAEEDFEKVIDYLNEVWGGWVTDNFLGKFEEMLNALSERPEMYQFVDPAKNIQKYTLTKYNTVY